MLKEYLEQIYALPRTGDLGGLVDLITEGAGAHKSLFQVLSLGSVLPDVFSPSNITEDEFQPFFDHYHQHHIWMDYLLMQPSLFGMRNSLEIIPRREYESSVWFNEFVKASDIYGTLGPVFPIADGRVGIFSAFSPVAKPTFEKSQSQFIESITPHLQRAINLYLSMDKLRLERNFFSSVCSMPRCARMLLDRFARLRAIDERAEQIIRTSRYFRLRQDRLSLRDPMLQRQFTASLETAVNNDLLLREAPAPIRVGGPSGTAYVINCDPFQLNDAADFASGRYVIVSLHEPAPPPIEVKSQALMQALYDLTAAECKIAALLLEGKDPAAAADSLGISKQTVRQHLKSIMRKTNTHRQVELIAQLLRAGCA